MGSGSRVANVIAGWAVPRMVIDDLDRRTLGAPGFEIVGNQMTIQMRWADGTDAVGLFGGGILLSGTPDEFTAPGIVFDYVDVSPCGIELSMGVNVQFWTTAAGQLVVSVAPFSAGTVYVWVELAGRWYASPPWSVSPS